MAATIEGGLFSDSGDEKQFVDPSNSVVVAHVDGDLSGDSSDERPLVGPDGLPTFGYDVEQPPVDGRLSGDSSDERPLVGPDGRPTFSDYAQEEHVKLDAKRFSHSMRIFIPNRRQFQGPFAAMHVKCKFPMASPVQCCFCPTVFHSFSGLVKDLQDKHLVPVDWMEASNLLQARSDEQRNNLSKAAGKAHPARHVKSEQGHDQPDVPHGSEQGAAIQHVLASAQQPSGGSGIVKDDVGADADDGQALPSRVGPASAKRESRTGASVGGASPCDTEASGSGCGVLANFLASIKPLECEYDQLTCPFCRACCQSARAWINHLRGQNSNGHNVDATALCESTLVQLRRLQETHYYNTAGLALSDIEDTCIAPMTESKGRKIKCKFRNCGCEVPKRQVVAHYHNVHKDDPDCPTGVERWLSACDGVPIKHFREGIPYTRRLHLHCRFEVAHMRKHGVKHTAAPPAGIPELLQQQIDVQRRTSAAIEDVGRGLHEKRFHIDGGRGGGGDIYGPLPLPEVTLRPDVEAWEGFAGEKKGSWPEEFRKFPTRFDLQGFRTYLEGINHNKDGTVDAYVQGVEYYFQLWEFEEGPSVAEVLGALWKHNEMQRASTKPIFDCKSSITAKIAGSLVPFCTHVILQLSK